MFNPGLGRCPGKGNGNPLQCSCLENSWREEPSGWSMGSQRVGHNWVTNTFICICHVFSSIHSLVSILIVSILRLLWIMVLMYIQVKIFVWTYFFNSFEYIVMRGISGSYHNSIFKLLRKFQTNFQSGYPTLNSYQHCMRVLISPPPQQENVIFSIFCFMNPTRFKMVPIFYLHIPLGLPCWLRW